MKRFSIIFFWWIMLFSCQNKEAFIIGTWKIEGVGTADTTAAGDKILAYALLTMQSAGAEWEFTKDGSFKIYNQEKNVTTTGMYSISKDEKSITFKVNSKEDNYELIKKGDKQIQIKSLKDSSIINLNK